MSGAFTWHGGRLSDARAHFGDGPHPWIDLSTGVNPAPWPGALSAGTDWQNLPDPAALRALEQAAAACFGVDADYVCAVPGSELGLRLLGTLIDGPAYHRVPSYRTHSAIFAGSKPLEITAPPPVGSSVLVMANPNNPDGRVLGAEAVRQSLARQAEVGGWLVVDEAFADVTPRCSVAPLVGDSRPLIVTRSFGKFFGLAGVRLGFVLGPRAILARLRALLGDWPISAAGVVMGTAAYRDVIWIAAAREAMAIRAAALDTLLRAHGLDPSGDCALFRLIDHPDAQALFTMLGRQQILTRPFAENPRWLRFGLPYGEAELGRLDGALRCG